VRQWAAKYTRDRNDVEIVRKLRELVQIVTKTYLAKTERDLLDAKQREEKERFAPIEQQDRITETLDEAYKGLKWVLEDLDKQTYHDLVRELKEL
jgi:vacuolar-type H+-ATPase subunit B/Vma2